MYGFDEDEYQENSNDIEDEDIAIDEDEPVDPEAQAQANRRFSKAMFWLFAALVGVALLTVLAPSIRAFLSQLVR